MTGLDATRPLAGLLVGFLYDVVCGTCAFLSLCSEVVGVSVVLCVVLPVRDVLCTGGFFWA